MTLRCRDKYKYCYKNTMFPPFLCKVRYQQFSDCIKMHTDTVQSTSNSAWHHIECTQKWIRSQKCGLHDSLAPFLEESSWEYVNSLLFYGSLWKQMCCGGHCCTGEACVIVCEVSILQCWTKNSPHLLYSQRDVHLILTSYRIHDCYCSWSYTV